jgi:hypothetical protein
VASVESHPPIDRSVACHFELLSFETTNTANLESTVVESMHRCMHVASYTFKHVQEITLIYPQLHPPELNAQASNRVCNALALFQCVASHSETRELFLLAQIPLFLYPFLNTTSKTRPFEYLRLTALGVIGALVKQDDSTVRFS